jgi:hypothetical protein
MYKRTSGVQETRLKSVLYSEFAQKYTVCYFLFFSLPESFFYILEIKTATLFLRLLVLYIYTGINDSFAAF